MLRNTLQFSLALSLVGYCIAPPSLAQVSGDGSLSTTVNSPDSRNFVIDGGDRAGNNLFHSFREFSVPTGGSAYFNNATDVQNIFSRVTGGNASNIDGLLRANGNANLFLLNPSGILFGRNARLNIGGSFVGTTANQVRFADGATFSATSPTTASLLTVSLPVGLQLGQNSGSIQVQGQGHTMLHPGGFTRSTTRNPQLAGLRVLPGETLALIGNTLRLEGGVLIAESGQIELGSISSGSGSIGLNTTLPTWDFRYGDGATRANIQLTNAAFLDASGAPGGTIHLYGQTTQIQNSSALLIQSQGSQNSGSIRVDTDRLELNGALLNLDQSVILSEKAGSGQGANIDVTARQILFRDGGELVSMTFQPGNNAGNITVNATESILLNGSSPLDPSRLTGILARSNTQGGRGGNVTLTTPDLRLQESGAVGAQVFGGAGGCTLNITADQISLTGESARGSSASVITSTTFSGGNAGDITIDVGRLFL